MKTLSRAGGVAVAAGRAFSPWRVARAAGPGGRLQDSSCPAAPGGGWDQLGRAVGQSMQGAKLAERVQVVNVGGRGGTIGLAQLINSNKGDRQRLMVTGKGMVSAVLHQQVAGHADPGDADRAADRRVRGAGGAGRVEPADDGRPGGDATRRIPGGVSWGGGLAGGVDQLTAGMIVQAIGGESAKFNYVAFNSGGEVLAQTLGGHVTVGIGGYNEFAAQITAGKLRALAITSAEATRRRQHPDVEGTGHRRRVRQLARADGGAGHQRCAAPGAGEGGVGHGQERRLEGDA